MITKEQVTLVTDFMKEHKEWYSSNQSLIGPENQLLMLGQQTLLCSVAAIMEHLAADQADAGCKVCVTLQDINKELAHKDFSELAPAEAEDEELKPGTLVKILTGDRYHFTGIRFNLHCFSAGTVGTIISSPAPGLYQVEACRANDSKLYIQTLYRKELVSVGRLLGSDATPH